jgi:hypothetical protein
MKPLPVQLEALRRSNGAVGFAYYMEQGLGKTLTSQMDLLEMVNRRLANRSIVITPNSFKGGWVDDTKKHGMPINQMVFESGSDAHVYWARRDSNEVRQIIVNYEALRSENTLRWLIEWAAARDTMILADESIKLKDHKSLQTKAALELAKACSTARVLSGKPIAQGPADLWAQMRFIKHLNGFEFYPFKTAFSKMGGPKMKQVLGAQNEDILAERIDPVIFRATKAEWAKHLPPKSWTIRDYKMTPEQAAQYKSMHEEFVLWLNSDEVVTVDAAITKYIKLAQIQVGWIYDENKKMRPLIPDERNPRLQLLLELLEEEVVGKVAIAYHHKPVFDQLIRNLGGEQNCAWIRGGMTPQEITEQKRRFNEDRSVRYILLQDDASKYGHTLLGLPEPGYMCYTMVIYENNYSLDTRSQIEDRIHREGQIAEAVLYIDLCGTPLDRDCIRALQRKEGIFQAVFSRLRQ